MSAPIRSLPTRFPTADGNTDTATISIDVSDLLVNVRLEATDLAGQPDLPDRVLTGQQFQLRAYVPDLRADAATGLSQLPTPT